MLQWVILLILSGIAVGLIDCRLALSEILRRERTIMADLDDLNATLDAISSDVDDVSTHVGKLTTELTQLQGQGPSVDLSGVLERARTIQAKLDALKSTVDDAGASGAQPNTGDNGPPPTQNATTGSDTLTGASDTSAGTATGDDLTA
jgi:hypothetical protein